MNEIALHIHKPSKKLSMVFEGVVTFDLIDAITMALSKRLDEIESSINVRKKVFGVLMECLQNLGHHVEAFTSEPGGVASVLFIIDATEDGYHVATGNYIALNKAEELNEWLSNIKGLSKEQLRNKYNAVLIDPNFSPKGGGGLGFLDIAMRVDGNINFKFEPVNSELAFFIFQALIKK